MRFILNRPAFKTLALETPMMSFRSLVLATALAFVTAAPALAADAGAPPEYTVVLRNHLFEPTTVSVKPGTRFVLVVRNEDATGDEVESHALKIEKRIGGHQTIKLPLGPLEAGSYPFVAEQHEDIAKGEIVVK